MVTWTKFENSLRKQLEELTKNGIEENNLQFEKIIARTLIELFIIEGTIKRKQLPFNDFKKTQGKFVLYKR